MPEFRTKSECLEYSTKMNLAFYQRDLNGKSEKIFISDTHEKIYENIISGKNNYYETWSAHQPLKLYIDYDKKANSTNTGNHVNDIVNIIKSVCDIIQNKIQVYILKSYPDEEKKSYHIIFEGIHFQNYRIIKSFMEEKLKPLFPGLFADNIIDTKVYAPICLRSLLCTKFGQNRPLFLLDYDTFMNDLNEKIDNKVTLEVYKSTCITFIRESSILYTYKTEKKRDSNSKKVHLRTDSDIYTDKEIIKKYIDVLDPSRYTDRNKWLNIGYILHSISTELYDIWHYFSMKWDKYSESACDIAWNSFSSGEKVHTIHNLIHLANIDNPSECALLTNDIPEHDIKYLRPFDNVISKLIYRMYGQKFVCSNPEKNEWYHFNEIRWIKENKSHNLRKKMINEVFQKVEAHRRALVKECADEEIIKNYHYILKILGSGTKLNCLELEFYNSKFYKIIDQNKHLLGFDNGVFDLDTMEFRVGLSTDYISMTTGYSYSEVSKSSVIYQKLIKLVKQILPDKDTRDFTLKALSSCLDGYTVDENFYIFTGKNSTGGNGKSTLVDLTMKALGDYACNPPVTLLTAKRESSSNANSALVGIMNKRLALMQEPEVSDVIQAGIMKGLTGGDKVSTRELHSSQIEFKPHAKFIICCNKMPGISDIDGGVIRRIKITEFTSRFVDNPKYNEDGIHEFMIDRTIKDKYDEYAPVFMCILLDYYTLYKSEGLVPPESVLKVTKKYENDNNAIKYFIDENITKNKDSFITRDEIKEMYKNDFTLKTSFKKFPDFIRQFEDYLNVEFKMDRKKIYRLVGYSIKYNAIEDDDTEEEKVV